MTPRATPCLNTNAAIEHFQFHGKQCAGCDKADDTTRTMAVSWKLHAAICEAFRFCNWSEGRKSVKKKRKKRKFNTENQNYTQKSQTFDNGLFDAVWIVSRFYNYFSAIKTSLVSYQLPWQTTVTMTTRMHCECQYVDDVIYRKLKKVAGSQHVQVESVRWVLLRVPTKLRFKYKTTECVKESNDQICCCVFKKKSNTQLQCACRGP